MFFKEVMSLTMYSSKLRDDEVLGTADLPTY